MVLALNVMKINRIFGLGVDGKGEAHMGGLVMARDAEKNKTKETWGSLSWMANQSLSGSSVTVGRLILHPGLSDFPHSHSNADEVIYLLKGSVSVQMGGREVVLMPGDALTIPLKLAHRIRNNGTQEAEMTLSYSSGIRKYTAE
jgi:mannose-6-phosphate isomerase-like protein (cupin superfamily)